MCYERTEHSATDFVPGILHRSDKPGSLTKNILSIPKPNKSKDSEIPIPATPSTFSDNVDIKNIPNSPQSAKRSSAKHFRNTNEFPSQPNKITTYKVQTIVTDTKYLVVIIF